MFSHKRGPFDTLVSGSSFDVNQYVLIFYYGLKPKHDIKCFILTDIIFVIQITAYYNKRLFFQTHFVYRGVICGKDDTNHSSSVTSQSTPLVLCNVNSKCNNTPAVDID